MSAHHPRRRLPISCEPCRARKIRCSRNKPPCDTCVRRRIPLEQCVYSCSRQPHISTQRQPQPCPPQPQSLENDLGLADVSVQPRFHDPAGDSSADLIARLQRLEQLLQVKNEVQDQAPPPPSVRGLGLELENSRRSEPETALSTGALISSTSGHVRFLPNTCGWRIVHRASQEGSIPSQENPIADTPSGPYPFGENDTESRPNLLLRLPPTEYCDQLKDLYFQSFAPLFPILHSPTFHERYRQFSRNLEHAPLAWLALLFTTLGTAVLALQQDNPLLNALSRKTTPWDQVTELSERYYTAAMKCLEADRYLWRHNIWTLQALLNLIYGIHHSHGQTWTLLGLVYHLAMSIGCHVDPNAFSLDIVEAEERRRCWLGLTTLLCNQNMAITGCDIYQSVLSSRVLEPAEVWDEDIVHGQLGTVATSVGIKPVSYLVRKSRLFRISSKICNPTLVPRSDDTTALRRLDAAIRTELDPLEQSYASVPGVNTSVVHTNLLLSFAHHLVLLLHSSILDGAPLCLPQHTWSKQCCLKSAQRVLELHADFHRLPQFKPFYWYIRGRGAFHAFHAAFVLLMIFSMEPREPCPLDIVQLLHDCHARLEASKTQSQLCTRTATILGRMLSSRWFCAPTLASGGLDSCPRDPASQDTQSNTQIDLDQLMNSSNGQASISESAGFPSLVRQIEPQRWINPVDMDWDLWDSIMASCGTTS
ncbi:hypothetical protein BDV06DRAFT_22109 [Aspergillus oleicola]